MVSDDEDCAAESILLRQEKPTGPLHGVIIAVSKKLSSHQSEFNQMVKALGGDFRWTYDDSCTHYVFQVSMCITIVITLYTVRRTTLLPLIYHVLVPANSLK